MDRSSKFFKTQLSRRLFILGSLQAATLTTLAGRLYYLQLIKSERYQTLSEDNRIKLELVAPLRGKLLDRNGHILTNNHTIFQLVTSTNGLRRGQLEEYLHEINSKLGILSEFEIKKAMRLYARIHRGKPLLIKPQLDWQALAKIESHKIDFSRLQVVEGHKRFYPLGERAAHVLGYMGAVSKDEQGAQPLLRLPEFQIGKSGIEKIFESDLRGTAGLTHLETDAHNLPIRVLKEQPATPGKDIQLTLDARLQAYASERLGKESGGIVLMEIPTGNILSLVSMPAFDPNIFSAGIPKDYWQSLQENTRNPLLNKATQGQYPPGSTFKMLVGLAGLESGHFSAQSYVHCPGYFYLGNHRFRCWKQGGHGAMNIHSAIAHSCDTYFYTMANRIGIDAIAKIARTFGLGHTHLPGFPAELPGIVPDNNWKMKRFGQAWRGGDTVNVGIGQGYILATPLQLAVMTARLATGLHITPTFIPRTDHGPALSMDIDPQHLYDIQKGMDMVTNTPGGTAYSRRIEKEAFAMAGKTGTSQVRRITKQGMNQDLLPWKERHHALFVGYAPVHAPRYACACIIEHGGGGSSAAAPVVRDILLTTQKQAEETA